ncbi:putative flavonol 3-O-glucosyltransferase [Helianthus annuus]|uniref:Flavonol 3-O-glucosyltransferase n=1 Tax=Helianthus annuus TaxID=4232 RepID=A0A251UC91_HELAN|nr:putative flavonol 3-O-glucosyltransferase [Helianthus annuus]KAJ0549242.1 putative flavonol 3-O-glucosyltransferase [Helianthus annuus]KAJ0562197.1 putative flavonol 3-O-glucosyltransferase [Helianthus annuus]KAJ0727571.1 putative flavonol 3-O-glucosyltransferase [Helianthus annuus]KAJ0906854.1 putative flavonol 3-O-glucosyltransferase [Helianthus annuus]
MANNTFAELVFIPAPAVGHIMSTIEMAKLLFNRDQTLSVTLLIINPPYSVLPLTTYIESLAKNAIERMRFIKLRQDQSPPKLNSSAPFVMSFYEFINSHCKYVRNILEDAIDQTCSRSRVVGLVVNILCTSMIDVSNEYNLPTYVYFTSNAAFLGFKLHFEMLFVDQKQDLIELANSEDEIVIPTFVNPVPMKLETHAINSFSGTNFPPVYPVGPILNLDGIGGKPDDTDVFRWLQSLPPSSVVLLCFGSMGGFDEAQAKEIARGLEQSGHLFIWSMRRLPPPEQSLKVLTDDFDDPRGVLPDGFLERTSGIGKVNGWAPQVSLLAHEAVGGFVSHCRWNWMLESLWFGVPTATLPMLWEQQMNAFEMVVELGLAVDLKLDYKINVLNSEGGVVIVTAEEIKRGIRRLMENKEVRKK